MRRLLLTLLLTLGLSAPAWAQITIVSGQTATSTTGTMWTTGSLDETLNFPGAVTSGNTVVAWTEYTNSARTMSCTHDGNAMTAVSVKGATSGSSNGAVAFFARVATSTGTGVTCSLDGTDANEIQAFAIAELSGMAATLSTQGGAGVTTTTGAETTTATTHDSGADLTPDTTHNFQMVGVVCVNDGGTWTDDGATMLINGAFWRVGYIIQSSTTALDWVPTSSSAASCEVTAQNLDGAGAGAAAAPKLTLLGVGTEPQ